MSRVTLSRYLIEQTRSNNTPADLRFLIEVVARACKEISHAVSKGALGGVLGSMGTENVQGEVQKKLDVLSNDILLEANEWGGHLAGMASEEMDNAYQIPGQYPKGAYLLVFDPLDGSSNIDVQRLGRHHLLGVALPNRAPEPERQPQGTSLPAARHPAGRCRLRHLRPADHADPDLGQRREGFHPGPRDGQLRADPRKHPDPGNHRRIRHQHVQQAPLGSPGDPVRGRAAGR